MRQCTGVGLAYSQKYNRHLIDKDETESGDHEMQESKPLVHLILQVLNYKEEERRKGKEEGRARERKRVYRKGKWKKKREGRKEDKNAYLRCDSCNSVEKRQAGFKVTDSLVILILDCDVKLWSPILFFLLIVTEIVIPNPKNQKVKWGGSYIDNFQLEELFIKQWSMRKMSGTN